MRSKAPQHSSRCFLAVRAHRGSFRFSLGQQRLPLRPAERPPQLHLLPPPGRFAVVAPVLVQGEDTVLPKLHERSHMAGDPPVPGKHQHRRDDLVLQCFHPFQPAVPPAGIGTVCPDELLCRELFAGIMPVDGRLRVKESPHLLRLLGEDRLPILYNIQNDRLLFWPDKQKSPIGCAGRWSRRGRKMKTVRRTVQVPLTARSVCGTLDFLVLS